MAGRMEDLTVTFRRTEGALRKVPGFTKAEALVNHNTLQVQLLFRFNDVDCALNFVKNGAMKEAIDPYQGLVDANSTMVISVVEATIAR